MTKIGSQRQYIWLWGHLNDWTFKQSKISLWKCGIPARFPDCSPLILSLHHCTSAVKCSWIVATLLGEEGLPSSSQVSSPSPWDSAVPVRKLMFDFQNSYSQSASSIYLISLTHELEYFQLQPMIYSIKVIINMVILSHGDFNIEIMSKVWLFYESCSYQIHKSDWNKPQENYQTLQ